MGSVLSVLQHVNLSFFSAQISVLTGAYQLFGLLVVLFVFLYGISVGKTRATVSLLAIFAGYALTAFFPFWSVLVGVFGEAATPFIRAGVFLIAYLLAIIAITTSSLSHRLTAGDTSFPKVLTVSVLQVGLLAGILVSFVPVDQLPVPLDTLRPFLASQLALFTWSALALAALPLLRGNRRRSSVV